MFVFDFFPDVPVFEKILSGANFSHHSAVGSTGDCPGKLAHARDRFFRTKKIVSSLFLSEKCGFQKF
jgi:hypothetical protein